MTSQTEQIRSLIDAAHTDGLTPVPGDDGTVDLHLMRNREVVAAIRVHLGWDGTSTFEYPARRGLEPLAAPEHHPWSHGPFRPSHLRDLDRWWAQVPDTGRVWRTRPCPWAKAGYWKKRLGHEPGPIADLERAAA